MKLGIRPSVQNFNLVISIDDIKESQTLKIRLLPGKSNHRLELKHDSGGKTADVSSGVPSVLGKGRRKGGWGGER